MPPLRQATALPSAEDVERFLRAAPGFLRERPELYRVLEPPKRFHDECLSDHMAALLAAERVHAAKMQDRANSVLQSGRAAAGLSARVHEAVVALIRTDNVSECIMSEFPPLLAIDAASLCVETQMAGARPMMHGAIDSLLGSRSIVYRSGCTPDDAIHGEAAMLADCEVLVRIPGRGSRAMLALTARNSEFLAPNQGSGALIFLGRAVAAALGR